MSPSGRIKYVSVETSKLVVKCGELELQGAAIRGISPPYDVYTAEGRIKHVTITYERTLTEQGGQPCTANVSLTS